MMRLMEDRAGHLSDRHGSHDFESLFAEAAPGVWRTMVAFTGGRREVAEEATAEAFARALAHADGIRDPLPWIYRTAFRLAKEELRRERRPMPTPDMITYMPAGTGEVIRALSQLSPNQRMAVILRYEADLSNDEVARRMGVAQATVRVHLFRARARLRQLLGSEEIDDE
jgi:RNA polymerase sigma factor (sigma-70 family)